MRTTWNGGHRRFSRPAHSRPISLKPDAVRDAWLERVRQRVAARNERLATEREARGPSETRTLNSALDQVGQLGERLQ